MKMSRRQYAALYGPTTGDVFRLGDTSLLAEVEHDHALPGEELTTGAGKTMRDGEGFSVGGTDASGALDMIVQNALILDPVLGVVKGDIGVRRGRIVAVGKAGNPDIMDGVTPGLVAGPNTTMIHGDQMIVTPGVIEAHAHFLSPQQVWHALAGGCTTMIGMSPGPHFDTSCAGPHTLGRLIQAADEYPINFGFLGRGCSDPGAVTESVAGGALGVKIHEDLGASPAVIDGCLRAADAADFSVHIHTDTINEFGYCEDTMDAVAGRTIHMYHTEGAGGGHAPDILAVNGWSNVIPSSTNPTNPFTPAALEEGVPMTMLAHMMSFELPEDVAFAECRIRPQTMAAEDMLHDMGAISIFATDTQGMGRLAENATKAFQLASVMKDRVGRLAEEKTKGADNERILRYLAKLTINPAIGAGIDSHVGSIEAGKLADLVVWRRDHFAAKPEMVIKAGEIVWSKMGDGNGSFIGAEPLVQRPMWGALGTAKHKVGFTFASRLAIDNGVQARLGVQKEILPIRSVRALSKADMIRNAATPKIAVDPQSFAVTADGVSMDCPPVTKVPLARSHFLR
ncbi:urease subunit alpha [Microbaculum marinum]|uniref:Urease subunit alpha n=1 Tax=Microbaculum marinum TaxID=1764581 RepID=A0AAW9RQE1_9HYPH